MLHMFWLHVVEPIHCIKRWYSEQLHHQRANICDVSQPYYRFCDLVYGEAPEGVRANWKYVLIGHMQGARQPDLLDPTMNVL
jgi:hypothetical protein